MIVKNNRFNIYLDMDEDGPEAPKGRQQLNGYGKFSGHSLYGGGLKV